jgi:hypothetical protein
MKAINRKILGALLSLAVIFGGSTTVLAEDAIVNTGSIDTIQIDTVNPSTPSTTENNPTSTGSSNEAPIQDTNANLSADKNLKDDLYDGNILIDNNASFDSVFEKLTVKGRELVENVRKAVIPYLIIAWIGLFAFSIIRILTGERGVSSRLVGGLLLIVIAYCGIVYAEVFISGMVHFFVS